MSIAIVNCVYPPEPVVSAQMGHDLAVHLTKTGRKVTVICPSPSRPLGADYSALHAQITPLIRQENGISVVRVPSFASPASCILRRMRESFSFGRHVTQYLKTQPNQPDIVYVNSWPLLSQAIIIHHCTRQRIPVVLHIQDTYPESLLAKLPHLVGRAIEPPLLALDRWIARKAAHVITISETMKSAFLEKRGIAHDRLSLIHNWVDDAPFHSMPDRTQSANHYKIPNDLLTFVFLGNIGPVAGVELLIDGFHKAAIPKALLLIIGDGSSKAGCVRSAQELGVTDRIHFISDPAMENVPRLLSLGDVCLLPMRKGAGSSSLPSKIMAYMLAGKPVLAAVDGDSDTAACIRDAGCGWVVEPNNAQALAQGLRDIGNLDRAVLADMGKAGAAYGTRQFSATSGLSRITNILHTVCSSNHPT